MWSLYVVNKTNCFVVTVYPETKRDPWLPTCAFLTVNPRLSSPSPTPGGPSTREVTGGLAPRKALGTGYINPGDLYGGFMAVLRERGSLDRLRQCLWARTQQ